MPTDKQISEAMGHAGLACYALSSANGDQCVAVAVNDLKTALGILGYAPGVPMAVLERLRKASVDQAWRELAVTRKDDLMAVVAALEGTAAEPGGEPEEENPPAWITLGKADIRLASICNLNHHERRVLLAGGLSVLLDAGEFAAVCRAMGLPDRSSG